MEGVLIMKKIITSLIAAIFVAATPFNVSQIALADSASSKAKITPLTDQQEKFLDVAAVQAEKSAKKYGVYPSVMLAQAIVESNWGQSELAVNANNLFGMKANDTWTGDKYAKKTREEDADGNSYYITAEFRKYATFNDSFNDNGTKLRHGISTDPLFYQKTWIENAPTFHDVTKALTGTYATAHDYYQTLDKRIVDYDLTKYDPQISNAKTTYYVKKNGPTYQWPTDHTETDKASTVTSKQKVTVTKTITYYNATQRMYISGQGWINGSYLTKKQPKVSRKLQHNARIYNKKGKVISKKKLKKGTKVNTESNPTKISGKKFYKIGKNKYVKKTAFVK